MTPAGAQIYVALDPIDMRWGFDRLAGFATSQTGYDARSGAMFVFHGKRRTTLKVLFADASGIIVFHKRLDSGTFQIPFAPIEGTSSMAIDHDELDALLDGLSIARSYH